jgi:hypothetical protein
MNIGETRHMQRAIKLLLFDVSAFYVLGLSLLIKTYWFDERNYFFFIMMFWAKMTMAMVGFGITYWLYCIVGTSFGHPPKAPVRLLRRTYLLAGICLLIAQTIHWPPHYFHVGDGVQHYYER